MSKTIKRMLIDATHAEEIRVAIVNGQKLDDLDVEYTSKEQKKSNIYLATISRIEPSLEAVFVNYGANRHGFLPLKEIEPSYFSGHSHDPKSDIRRILSEGQELLIQVDKEERGNKGAALTTYISLAGCYLVLMPNNPKAGGISRRIEGEDRDEMKETLNALTIPDSMGVIIRTAGLGKKQSDLQWDLDVLLNHWNAIKNAASSLQAPCLLHQESNIIIRTIRDNLKPDIKEILIDDERVYNQAKQYMELLRADTKNIVQHYTDSVPLFTKYQIESQIEEAYRHEIRLPSGGSIVLDRTEALTAIDINSAQSTKGHDIENTALNTNLEAATEIARQLRLRDVGGLIVIDFIDMAHIKNQREVENKLREELQNDRAKTQINRLSKFGLLEMSRQRLKASLGENTQITCDKCCGKGSIRTIESLSLSLIRLIEEEALKPNTAEVQTQLPLELCTFLTNEKRQNILEIEKRCNTRIILIPNPHYMFPNYTITRMKSNDARPTEVSKSYAIIEKPRDEHYVSHNKPQASESEAAVLQQFNGMSARSAQRTKPNLLKRLWSSLFDAPAAPSTQQVPANRKRHDFKDRNRGDHRGQRDHREQRDSKDQRTPKNHSQRRPHDRRDMNDRNEHRNDQRPDHRNEQRPEHRNEQRLDQRNEQRTDQRNEQRNDRNKSNYSNPRVPNKNRNKNRSAQQDNQRNSKRPSDNQTQDPLFNANPQFVERHEQQPASTRHVEDLHLTLAPPTSHEVSSDVTRSQNRQPRNPKVDQRNENVVSNVQPKGKPKRAANTNPSIELPSTELEVEVESFQKRRSLTKINRTDNLTKRTFHPKKKTVFEMEKHHDVKVANSSPVSIEEENNNQ